MSLQYMEAVRKSKHVRRSEKAVMLAIANRINDSTGICWPGVKQIAADAGICKKTAMKSIDSLVVKRFLVIEQEASGKRSRRYSLTWNGFLAVHSLFLVVHSVLLAVHQMHPNR